MSLCFKEIRLDHCPALSPDRGSGLPVPVVGCSCNSINSFPAFLKEVGSDLFNLDRSSSAWGANTSVYIYRFANKESNSSFPDTIVPFPSAMLFRAASMRAKNSFLLTRLSSSVTGTILKLPAREVRITLSPPAAKPRYLLWFALKSRMLTTVIINIIFYKYNRYHFGIQILCYKNKLVVTKGCGRGPPYSISQPNLAGCKAGTRRIPFRARIIL